MDPIVAVGRVSRVVEDAARATFLEVELAHHHDVDGEPVIARCRWCTPYGGLDFGDWWVPSVGSIVLCLFPGVAIEGDESGDLDDGYAVAIVPGETRPPVNGLIAPLQPGVRVSKTRAGESLDEHIRGHHDLRIEQDRSSVIVGDDLREVRGDLEDVVRGVSETLVEGAEGRETVGVFTWLFRAAASFLGDLAIAITAQTTLTLTGVNALAFVSSTIATLTAPEFSVTAATRAAITSALVEIIAADIRLGPSGAVLRAAIDERFVAIFNAHQHAGGGSDAPLSQYQISAGPTECRTVNTKMS